MLDSSQPETDMFNCIPRPCGACGGKVCLPSKGGVKGRAVPAVFSLPKHQDLFQH